jgi:methylmalonyl-CoA mutase
MMLKDAMKVIKAQIDKLLLELDPKNKKLIEGFEAKFQQYKNEHYIFKVRDKELKIATHYESLSHTQVPKVSTPKYRAWGDIAAMVLQENVPWRISIYSWNLSF